MNASGRKLLETIFARLLPEPFSTGVVAAQIKADGGHDIAKLSEEDIVAIIDGRFAGDLNEVVFSFSELLAYYAAVGVTISDKQVIAWCAVALVFGELCGLGIADWEMHLNILLDGLHVTKAKLDVAETELLLRRLFAATALPEPPK